MHIVHCAIKKAERHVGRRVYVVRDWAGKVHFWLYLRPHSGRLIMMVAVREDGTAELVRHVGCSEEYLGQSLVAGSYCPLAQQSPA